MICLESLSPYLYACFGCKPHGRCHVSKEIYCKYCLYRLIIKKDQQKKEFLLLWEEENV